MSGKAAQRERGRAYECACGEEKLHLTHCGPDARHAGWIYLFGECGGGVKLRLVGAKVMETRAVDRDELERVKSLPVRAIDPYASMIERVDQQARQRLDVIVAQVREALSDGMKKWIAVGELLAEAKRLLRKGDFGLWVEHNGMDRVHAFKFISIHEALRALPAFSQTFVKIGQEKTVALLRLPEAKRLELLESGVPIDGKPKPLEDITFRELNTYVRSVVGKSNRGRKAQAKPEERPSERLGLDIATFDAFQGALKGLQALKKKAKEGWSEREKPAARKLWGNVNHLFFTLQDELGMSQLLDHA